MMQKRNYSKTNLLSYPVRNKTNSSTSLNDLENNNNPNYKIYEEKLKKFVEEIKTNKIKYNALKIVFEYEDNFKLVLDIYKKHKKSKLELEILSLFLKSLVNFISLIHSNEPISQLDVTLDTVNRYLKVKTFEKNQIVYRIGDFGAKYYIILKGKAYTLVPRKFVKSMTFDEYRNHLILLYIFGEDYLLEQTMHNNAKSCDISYSDIDNITNRNLKQIYKNNYSCNYEKYIRIINGDEHIMIGNNINDYISEDDEEKDIIQNQNINNIERNTTFKVNKDKNRKIFKFFKKIFIYHDIKKEMKIKDSFNLQNESINENNYKEDNQLFIESENSLYFKQILKDKVKYKRIKDIENLDLKQIEEINSFNIGVPQQLLIKDKNITSQVKYDGGELPTFFGDNINNKEMKEKNYNFLEEENKIYKIKNNLTKSKDPNFNLVLNKKRNLIIVGYTRIGVLLSGMNFGEISLLKENHLQTNTLFIAEDSQIGKLNINEYNITVKAVRTKIRTNSINFLLSTKLFGNISYNYFLNKYWIYFQCKKIQKGEFLFKIGEECENLYIIYNGEIKLNSYIDKENIDDLINGLKKEKNKPIKYKIHNSQNNNSNNNSIFERIQKFCLMIGKKGDILGLSDIINYQTNKFICEGEVISDQLSYYEINKNIIFGKISTINNNNNTSSSNTTFNIENIENIIKTKEEFMINRLNDIKMAIEQRTKYLNSDGSNSVENNKIINKKNKIIKEGIKNYKLNKNRKSLTLNEYDGYSTNHNNYQTINSNSKQIFSMNYLEFEKIKESLNKIKMQQKINQRKLSENNDKSLIINKTIADCFSKGNNQLNLKLKNNIEFKNTIKLNSSNLSKDVNHSGKENTIKLEKDFNLVNNSNNKNCITFDNSKNINDEGKNHNYKKINYYKMCKPYEFPKIQNEKNNYNWDSFRKIKILKFLFLNDENLKYKLFKYNKTKKQISNQNYFINTLKRNTIKNINNNFFNSENIENDLSYKKNKNNFINNINTENTIINMKKNEKNQIKPIKLNLKIGNRNSNHLGDNINLNQNSYKASSLNKKNKTSIDNSFINKNNQLNITFIKNRNNSPFFNKYKGNSLLNNFYFSLGNKNNINKMKNTKNKFPYIEK